MRLSRQDVLGLLIFVCLCIQLWLPLSYYLIAEDKMDQAFAWRMFSDLHMTDKALEVRVEWQNTSVFVDLRQHFSSAWTRRLHRGPKWILREACSYLCERHTGVIRVSYFWSIEMWDGHKEVFTESIRCHSQ